MFPKRCSRSPWRNMDVTSVGRAEMLPKEAGIETKRAGNSIGNNKVCSPGVKEMDQNVGGDNRIGYPRGLYDSETRGDWKSLCVSGRCFWPQGNKGRLD